MLFKINGKVKLKNGRNDLVINIIRVFYTVNMYGFSYLGYGKCANATEDRVYNLFVQIIINFAPAFWQSWDVILGELFWWICAGLVASFFYGLSNKAIVAPIVFDVNRSIYNCLTVYRKAPMLALNIFAI